MKILVLWLYDTLPGFFDHLPPALLYLGLWAVIACVAAVVVAFAGFTLWWAITGVVGVSRKERSSDMAKFSLLGEVETHGRCDVRKGRLDLAPSIACTGLSEFP